MKDKSIEISAEEWLDIRTALLQSSLQCDQIAKATGEGPTHDLAKMKKWEYLKLAEKIAEKTS